MQDVTEVFLRRVRSIIENAERGVVTEGELSSVRSSMNELLALDWIMPRVVSEVSIHWKLIEETLRTIPEGGADAAKSAVELEGAWNAYRELEDALKAQPQ